MIAPIHRPLTQLVASPAMYWVTFKEIYCERLETRYPSSDHPPQVRRVLDRFTKYRGLVARQLDEITTLDLESYLAKRRADVWRGQPIGNRTLNNEINILNAAFAWAGPRGAGSARKNLGVLPEPPFCELLPTDDFDPRVCTEDQLSKFVAATRHARSPELPGFQPADFWVAVLVLDLLTALRRSALLRIPRPDDCVLHEKRELVLPPHLSKTRREQRITLGRRDEVLELFASLPSRPGEPLLPWKTASGRPLSVDHFSHTMAGFQKAAGIPAADRLKTKYLRSTAATELADQYGDAVAKKKLGHAPGSRTLDIHYKGRRITDRDRDGTDHLADLLFRCMRRERPDLGIFDEGPGAGQAAG